MRHLLRWIAGALIVCAACQAHAAWYEAKSKHFIIYSDDDPERITRFAERLERFDQAVRLVRAMDDPPLTDSNRLQVYVLPNEGAVSKLAGGVGASGMYENRASGSYAFVPRFAGSSQWDLKTEQIFFHEYAHHLLLKDSALALPTWVNEGFAEFFAATEIKKDGSIEIGSYPPYRVSGLADSAGLTLEDVVGSAYSKLNLDELNALYGRGWLLMHYLTFDKSRHGQLTKYVDGIQDGLSPLDSARAAFGDLKQLDRDLKKYMNAPLMGIVLKPEAVKVGNIALRPLRPGEAAIMPVHIRAINGVTVKTAPGVAADARKAAAPYPNDPFVQAVLAEAEYDVADFEASEAAADRALKADPNNVHALIRKGMADMAIAVNNPGTANWDQIRDWFIMANKIDTENAQPLELFYWTFGVAHQQPTKNAVDALLYAVALAPQDETVRMLAVRELLVENRVEEAKTMLAPLAYGPHASAEFREAMSKIMVAIAAGDVKSALKLLENDPEKKAEGASN